MLRGLVRLFATSLAVYPRANDGAGYDAVNVAEQDDDDCAIARAVKSARHVENIVVVGVILDCKNRKI
jgi:hypothetical protein